MIKQTKRLLALLLIFTLALASTVLANQEEEGATVSNAIESPDNFLLPDDTSFDDTVWTIEYEDGSEEVIDQNYFNSLARWSHIDGVAMDLEFKTGGLAAFSTTAVAQYVAPELKIKTQLQSYRDGAWKTLYTKTQSKYDRATNKLDGSYYVTKGYKYRTRNTISVYNSKGTCVESDVLNCTRTYK